MSKVWNLFGDLALFPFELLWLLDYADVYNWCFCAFCALRCFNPLFSARLIQCGVLSRKTYRTFEILTSFLQLWTHLRFNCRHWLMLKQLISGHSFMWCFGSSPNIYGSHLLQRVYHHLWRRNASISWNDFFVWTLVSIESKFAAHSVGQFVIDTTFPVYLRPNDLVYFLLSYHHFGIRLSFNSRRGSKFRLSVAHLPLHEPRRYRFQALFRYQTLLLRHIILLNVIISIKVLHLSIRPRLPHQVRLLLWCKLYVLFFHWHGSPGGHRGLNTSNEPTHRGKLGRQIIGYSSLTKIPNW